MAREQRSKEAQQFQEWQKHEDQFHLLLLFTQSVSMADCEAHHYDKDALQSSGTALLRFPDRDVDVELFASPAARSDLGVPRRHSRARAMPRERPLRADLQREQEPDFRIAIGERRRLGKNAHGLKLHRL